MDFALKPDRMNGQEIYRGVETGPDGVNHQNKFILFKPSMIATHGPVLPLEELVEQALRNIITVSDQTGDPVIKAQAIAFRGQLKKALSFWMKRADMNATERCRLEAIRG